MGQYDEIIYKNQNDEEEQTDFLEISLINEIKQTIEQLDIKCQKLSGEELVETRCRQLSYCKVLCDVYQKDSSLLIKPTAYLGEAYFDFNYFLQAQEHFETVLKLNENKFGENALDLEYLSKITLKLSKCYLETNRPDLCILLAERTLEMNKKKYKEKHNSFIEIYLILIEANKRVQNYEKSLDYLRLLFSIYEILYGYNSEESAYVFKQFAEIYELSNNIPDSIEYYLNYFKVYSNINKEDKNFEIFFQTAIKIAELYINEEQGKKAYEILKSTEEKYANKIKRTIKSRAIYQKCVIKACSTLKDLDLYLNEFFKLERILKESSENQKQLAKAYIAIGYIYLQKNDKLKCIDYYKKAEEIFKDHKDNELLLDIRKKIKEILDEEENKN